MIMVIFSSALQNPHSTAKTWQITRDNLETMEERRSVSIIYYWLSIGTELR